MASCLDKCYEELVAGVSVVNEAAAAIEIPPTTNNDCCHVTGVVKIKPNDLTASQLRDVLRRELPALPPDFLFLTKQGWPVREEQEGNISVLDLLDSSSIITIRRHFGQPRVGVRNQSHEVLGFIFINYNSSALELRQALREQLTSLNVDLVLLDSKGWPVHSVQEKDMLMWDLICDGYITIRSSIAESISWFSHTVDTTDGHAKKRKSSDWNNSGSHLAMNGKALPEFENGELPNILISYVRNEAAKHARDLKWQLAEKGYTDVFLDVDEIHGGHDWQDALNLAVQNCTLFVPLITPQYGQTVWTNREVKLADQLNKLIIPINFLDDWPPSCLAIQFTSLHFVPWKTPVEIDQDVQEGLGDRATDIRFWDTVYIKRVVEAISQCYQEQVNQYYPESQESMQIMEEEVVSFPEKDRNQFKFRRNQMTLPMSPTVPGVELDRAIEVKPLVVLSAHPNDKEYTENIKALLSDNYDVWSSSEILDEFEPSNSQGMLSRLTSPMTPVTPAFPDSAPIFNNNSQESTGSEPFYHPAPKRPSLQFSYSIDIPASSRHALFGRSDSQMTLSPVTMDKLKIFRNRANKAVVVIILLSKDYCNAKASLKQMYYCEHRKQVILIKISKFNVPSFVNCLFGNDLLQYNDSPEFYEDLKQHVKTAMNATSSEGPKICVSELRLQTKVAQLEKAIHNQFCIYVTGSTRICNARTENICNAIGQELAACNFISLATNGFYGVGEIVGRSFCEEQDLMGHKPANLFNILPHKDTKDLTKVSRQINDGTFPKIPYGQTLYYGDSVCERDSIVARAFRVCLLIEGGPDAAQEAVKFVWNDNVVIPVISTGGAAAGEHSAPSRIMDVPPGVSEADWMMLAKRDIPVEEIAAAVKRVLCSLKTKDASATDTGKSSRTKRSNKKLPKSTHH